VNQTQNSYSDLHCTGHLLSAVLITASGCVRKHAPDPNVRFRVLVFFNLTLYYTPSYTKGQCEIRFFSSAFLGFNPRSYRTSTDNIEL